MDIVLVNKDNENCVVVKDVAECELVKTPKFYRLNGYNDKIPLLDEAQGYVVKDYWNINH